MIVAGAPAKQPQNRCRPLANRCVLAPTPLCERPISRQVETSTTSADRLHHDQFLTTSTKTTKSTKSLLMRREPSGKQESRPLWSQNFPQATARKGATPKSDQALLAISGQKVGPRSRH